MNSRERVLATINDREPDRVPVDQGATAGVGINVSAYIRLRRALGLPVSTIKMRLHRARLMVRRTLEAAFASERVAGRKA